MPQPPAPPGGPVGGPAGKKKRQQRMLLIGGGAVLVLLFLYMRSKGGASQNATGAGDQQAMIDQAVANQQQQDASTYAAQGYGSPSYGSAGSSGGTIDTSGITSSLGVIDTDLQNLPSQIAAMQTPTGSAGAAPAAATAPTASAPITINVNGQPAATKASGVRLSTNVPKGDIAAPFGAKKPTAPAGYEAVGLGSGNWAFRPTPKPPVKPSGPAKTTGAKLTIKK